MDREVVVVVGAISEAAFYRGGDPNQLPTEELSWFWNKLVGAFAWKGEKMFLQISH